MQLCVGSTQLALSDSLLKESLANRPHQLIARDTGKRRKELKLRLLSPNKSLQRSSGRWYLVCNALAVIDKVPKISLGEPLAAELSRYAASRHLA